MQEKIKVVFKADVIPPSTYSYVNILMYILAFVNSTKCVYLQTCIIAHYAFTTCFLST